MAKRQKKDHRLSNLSRRQGVREIKQSFLIVCEGEKTEPDYFKAFRMTAATVKAVGQAMNTMTLVSKAISILPVSPNADRIPANTKTIREPVKTFQNFSVFQPMRHRM